jgi:hypothetical protein
MLRNGIAKVPAVVWKKVFEFVLNDPSTNPKATRMGQVCRLWCWIMKDNPRLIMEEKIWIAGQKMARAASRREAVANSKSLVRDLDKLNLSIQRLSYRIVYGMDSDPDMLKLERQHYNAAREVLEDSWFLDRIERFNFPLTVILDPIICSILSTTLFQSIFGPFFPGFSPEQNDAYFDSYDKIDSKDRAKRALMRVSVYKTALEEFPYVFDNREGRVCPLHTDAKRCMEKIFNVVNAFTGTEEDILTRTKYECDAIKIFELAFRLQTKAQMENESYDSAIFTEDVGGVFEAFHGEAIQGLSEIVPREVWLCVGLGMMTGRYDLPEAVYVKASVICDNWDPMC